MKLLAFTLQNHVHRPVHFKRVASGVVQVQVEQGDGKMFRLATLTDDDELHHMVYHQVAPSIFGTRPRRNGSDKPNCTNSEAQELTNQIRQLFD